MANEITLTRHGTCPGQYDLKVPGERAISYLVNVGKLPSKVHFFTPCREFSVCDGETSYFGFESAEDALLRCARAELQEVAKKRGLPFTDLTLKVDFCI